MEYTFQIYHMLLMTLLWTDLYCVTYFCCFGDRAKPSYCSQWWPKPVLLNVKMQPDNIVIPQEGSLWNSLVLGSTYPARDQVFTGQLARTTYLIRLPLGWNVWEMRILFGRMFSYLLYFWGERGFFKASRNDLINSCVSLVIQKKKFNDYT